jgi:hypothetical protein
MREADLKQSLKDTVFDGEEIYSMLCSVVSVEFPTCTVKPLDDEIEIDGIRLIADDKEKGIIPSPAIDSIVIVSFLDDSNGFVSLFSEIDSIGLRGDEFGGLVKVYELIEQLNIMTDRIDTLYNAINNGVTAAQDGGAALLGSLKASIATQTEKEDFSEIENENVTHG